MTKSKPSVSLVSGGHVFEVARLAEEQLLRIVDRPSPNDAALVYRYGAGLVVRTGEWISRRRIGRQLPVVQSEPAELPRVIALVRQIDDVTALDEMNVEEIIFAVRTGNLVCRSAR